MDSRDDPSRVRLATRALRFLQTTCVDLGLTHGRMLSVPKRDRTDVEIDNLPPEIFQSDHQQFQKILSMKGESPSPSDRSGYFYVDHDLIGCCIARHHDAGHDDAQTVWADMAKDLRGIDLSEFGEVIFGSGLLAFGEPAIPPDSEQSAAADNNTNEPLLVAAWNALGAKGAARRASNAEASLQHRWDSDRRRFCATAIFCDEERFKRFMNPKGNYSYPSLVRWLSAEAKCHFYEDTYPTFRNECLHRTDNLDARCEDLRKFLSNSPGDTSVDLAQLGQRDTDVAKSQLEAIEDLHQIQKVRNTASVCKTNLQDARAALKITDNSESEGFSNLENHAARLIEQIDADTKYISSSLEKVKVVQRLSEIRLQRSSLEQQRRQTEQNDRQDRERKTRENWQNAFIGAILAAIGALSAFNPNWKLPSIVDVAITCFIAVLFFAIPVLVEAPWAMRNGPPPSGVLPSRLPSWTATALGAATGFFLTTMIVWTNSVSSLVSNWSALGGLIVGGLIGAALFHMRTRSISQTTHGPDEQ